MKRGMETKTQKVGSLQIICKSVWYYLMEVRHSKLYFLSVIIFIFFSKYSKYIIKKQRQCIDGAQKGNDIFQAVCIITLGDACEFLFYHLYDYLNDVVFAKQQANIASRAFKNLIMSENREIDVTSGRVQYFINTGSKAMGKLVVNISFLVIAEILQILLMLCFVEETIGMGYIFILILCFFFILILHIKITEIKLMYKKRSNSSLVACDKALYEAFLNVDVIKSNNMEIYEVKKYHEKVREYEKVYIYYGMAEDMLEFCQRFLFVLIKVMVFIDMYPLYKGDVTELRKKTGALNLIIEDFSSSVFKVGSIYRKIKESLLNSRLAFEYLACADVNRKVTHVVQFFESKIEFRGVDVFAKERKILQNLNFEVRRGEKVALIGKNGLGKSTIFKTILGMQKYSGIILIDGVSIDAVDLDAYRSLFSYAPQGNFLFDDTIYYNITYGSSDVSPEAVETVSKKLNLHDQVMKQTSKYNTRVGERGEFLSGGMRQKIILARAFLRNACIFLFDEPLNNLDNVSGDDFINIVLGEAFADKTVIMIVHNHELLNRFDKTICIDSNAYMRTVSI